MMLKSVDRVAQIIEAIASESVAINDLAERFDIHRSTMFRIVQTLEQRQFVRRCADGRYAIGYRLLGLAHGEFDEIEIRKAAYVPLRQAQHVTGQTIHLAVLAGNEIMFVDKAESLDGVGLYARIGQPLPPYCTAVGKSILSMLSANRVDELLSDITWARYTDNTHSTRSRLDEDLARVTKRGWAIDDREYEDFANCVAVPITKAGNPVGAISVTALHNVADVSALLPHAPFLIKIARNISGAL